MSKETYIYGKRGLLRLAYLRYAEVSKETYNMEKETYDMAKETYGYIGISEQSKEPRTWCAEP